MIIELHLLQSFPVSNLNRDDLGQPKSVRFGGVTRARISSQSLKRAARDSFGQFGLTEEEIGWRTKRLPAAAAAVLVKRDASRDPVWARAVAALTLRALGLPPAENSTNTRDLLFVHRHSAERLADLSEASWDSLVRVLQKTQEPTGEGEQKETRKRAPRGGKSLAEQEPPSPERVDRAKFPSGLESKVRSQDTASAARVFDDKAVDIALFGRMITEAPRFNLTAASQVAHAFSTHAVLNEFDYYTALDDLQPEAEPGAGMIGTVDFNAACYYRYANLDLDQLYGNLTRKEKKERGKSDTIPPTPEQMAQVARVWLHSFVHAVPTGKQATMSARTVPQVLLGTVRERGAWSLANAFLSPVAGTDDLMAASEKKLLDHYRQIEGFYGTEGIRRTVVGTLSGADVTVGDAEHHVSVPTLERFVAELLDAAAVAD